MESRRGRPRREDQVQARLRQVMTLFRQEQSALDCCTTFDTCPGLPLMCSAVAERLPRAVYQRGTALDVLVQGAALDVLGDLYAAEHPRPEKLAHFIEAYFCEGRTIVDITTHVLGLSDRAHVSNHYRAEACDLIARRFLTLVESADPCSVSAGLREAFARQEQRWERANQRVSAALDRLAATRYDLPAQQLLVGNAIPQR